MPNIILASQSPRRKQLLEWAEIQFDVVVAGTDETFPPHLNVREAAMHIALEKARVVSNKAPQATVIAADTIVVLDGQIIGKPSGREEAIEILSRLNGKQHQVITGVAILNGSFEKVFADATDVTFHTLTSEQIRFYVDRYQPFDKAGAYAIQEWIGVVGIRSIHGDFYNVMGLPISRVVQTLREISPFSVR